MKQSILNAFNVSTTIFLLFNPSSVSGLILSSSPYCDLACRTNIIRVLFGILSPLIPFYFSKIQRMNRYFPWCLSKSRSDDPRFDDLRFKIDPHGGTDGIRGAVLSEGNVIIVAGFDVCSTVIIVAE